MNQSVTETSTSSRFGRIRKVSRLLKIGVLIYFIVPLLVVAWATGKSASSVTSVSMFGQTYSSFSAVPQVMWILTSIGGGCYLLGAISLYRLLNLYERGIIFAEENITHLRRIGTALLGYGLLGAVANTVATGRLMLYPVLLGGFVSPWVITGGVIYLITWIMDEGRKAQEEQALTV